MKKLMVSVLVTIVLLLGTTFAEDIPYPFNEIKAEAMKVLPDEDGDYIAQFLFARGENSCQFVLMYFPQVKVIAIYKLNAEGYCYHQNEDVCTRIIGVTEYIARRSEAIEKAKELWKEFKDLSLVKT